MSPFLHQILVVLSKYPKVGTVQLYDIGFVVESSDSVSLSSFNYDFPLPHDPSRVLEIKSFLKLVNVVCIFCLFYYSLGLVTVCFSPISMAYKHKTCTEPRRHTVPFVSETSVCLNLNLRPTEVIRPLQGTSSMI